MSRTFQVNTLRRLVGDDEACGAVRVQGTSTPAGVLLFFIHSQMTK